MFEVLSDEQRRQVLQALLEHNPQDDRDIVATDAVADDGTDRVRLVHESLPRLADAGYVDWNTATHEITNGPNFEEVRPLLEATCDRDR